MKTLDAADRSFAEGCVVEAEEDGKKLDLELQTYADWTEWMNKERFSRGDRKK